MALQEKNYDPALMAGASSDVTANQTITATSSQALAVGLGGATNPAFQVNTNTASSATGIDITSAAEASGVAVKVISSGTNENLTIDAKGSGTISLNATGTGAITLARATAVTGAATVTSTSASALTVGANGATNPVLKINANTGSVATGVSVTGAATGTAVAVAAIGSATDEHLTVDAKAAGTIKIGSVSTGLVSIATASSSLGMCYKRSVLASSGNTTMTSAMSGSTMLLDGAATDYTLPAIGAGDVGMEFWFVATIIATDQTITAGAADLLTGSIAIVDTAADVDVFVPNVTTDLIITLNGTTTGGKTVGSYCHLVAISATRWWVEGSFLTATETQSTPFS